MFLEKDIVFICVVFLLFLIWNKEVIYFLLFDVIVEKN